MLPGFLRKPLLALLWIVPTIALTAFTINRLNPAQSLAPILPPVKIPIQVIESGTPPKTIYVEVNATTIPEPSAVLLLPGSATLLFLRRR